MAKKVKLNDGIQDIDLTDTFIGQSFHDEISKSLSSSQTDFMIYLFVLDDSLTS